ncbi:nitric oxide dioxygenase [Deinobacterium chartae]|uniref:Nitric oxide dioxygenase n=1 Tax=Deinobacterium chartae TaxID=521158 RepID=A0A841HYX4_9DEIO|nr:globin family protein [Deinobacterium chartae]MBB6098076.1 nitric oxide dioxygenase [Deinobacterium chartae]
MNDTQIRLVQRSFAQVQPIAADAARLFYRRLFELDPDLRPLFRHDLEAQGDKLMAMLGRVIGSLEQLEGLAGALRGLGERHTAYGVQPRHYRTVGEALLWTLEQGLGDAFTPEVAAAWRAAYRRISDLMTVQGTLEPVVPRGLR